MIPGGKAVPGQALGPALGQAGINIGEFVTKFNAATAKQAGDIIPVLVNVYEDRSYDMTFKTTPAAQLILKAAGIEKGSGAPNTKKVATITKAQVREIAEKKLPDLNANDVDAAMKIIAGTARQMGVDVK